MSMKAESATRNHNLLHSYLLLIKTKMMYHPMQEDQKAIEEVLAKKTKGWQYTMIMMAA